MKAGEVSYRHAHALVDQVLGLDPADTAVLESQALPHARVLTVAKFTRQLRILREELNPESITERHTAAADAREVRIEPGADGMAWLTAHLPAAQAFGIHDRLTGIAKSLQHKEESRTVPPDLKKWLQIRDGTCRFPGCSRRAARSDVDHTDDWNRGGDTRHDNLAHLCTGHHTLKHNTRWKVAHTDGGILTWTSPSGRNYTTQPEIRLRA